jgi:hypothetical protein
MLVYRIEHRITGLGPYWGAKVKGLLTYRHACAQHRPTPIVDSKIGNVWNRLDYDEQESYKFGFDSIKKLDKWFCLSNQKELHNYGYVVKVYEVDEKHTCTSKYQTIFIFDKANFKETLSLKTK